MLQFEVIKHKEDFIVNHLIYFIPAAYFATAFKILDQQYQKTIESLNTKSDKVKAVGTTICKAIYQITYFTLMLCKTFCENNCLKIG